MVEHRSNRVMARAFLDSTQQANAAASRRNGEDKKTLERLKRLLNLSSSEASLPAPPLRPLRRLRRYLRVRHRRRAPTVST